MCVSVREKERETVLMLFLVRFLHIKDKTAETEAGFLSLSLGVCYVNVSRPV